jgi:hypothetical protein
MRFGIHSVKREEVGDVISGGGGVPAPEPVPTPEPEPAPEPIAASSVVDFPENWREGLPEDLRGDTGLSTLQSIPDLAKAYVSLQTKLGKDRITVPDQYATPDDWRAIYHKLGLPDKLENYEVEVPKGVDFEDGVLTELKKVAFDSNVMPTQLNTVLAKLSELNGAAVERLESQAAEKAKAQADALQKEWGQAFKQRIGMVQRAINEASDALGDENDVTSFLEGKEVDGIKLGDHPLMVKLFHYFTNFMAEDKFIDIKDPTAKSPNEIQGEINRIMGDRDHPYHNRQHPNHSQAIKDMEKMFKQLHPGQDANEKLSLDIRTTY